MHVILCSIPKHSKEYFDLIAVSVHHKIEKTAFTNKSIRKKMAYLYFLMSVLNFSDRYQPQRNAA